MTRKELFGRYGVEYNDMTKAILFLISILLILSFPVPGTI